VDRCRSCAAGSARWPGGCALGRRLRLKGRSVNNKRVQRIWREEGLQSPLPRRRNRSRPADRGKELLRADNSHHVWAVGMQFDKTMDGCRLKFLNVVDEFSRVCLAIRVGRRCQADDKITIRWRMLRLSE
jgi:hypothetical protein